MVQINTKHIIYDHTSSGVRHHNFGVTNIIEQWSDTQFPGSNYTAEGGAITKFKNDNVPFAFMAITGTADGNFLYTSPGHQQIKVGDTDINIMVVYLPAGGTGTPGGGPGIWVDAFNVDTGYFSDDTNFIKVLTPPTPPDLIDSNKTYTANWDGEISTTSAEHIRASVRIDGGTTPFLQWQKIVLADTNTILNDKDSDIEAGETNEIWFAFYQTIEKVKIPEKGDMYSFVSDSIKRDGGGTEFYASFKGKKVGPYGPLMKEIFATAEILLISASMNRDLRKEAVKLAFANLDSIKEKLLKNES